MQLLRTLGTKLNERLQGRSIQRAYLRTYKMECCVVSVRRLHSYLDLYSCTYVAAGDIYHVYISHRCFPCCIKHNTWQPPRRATLGPSWLDLLASSDSVPIAGAKTASLQKPPPKICRVSSTSRSRSMRDEIKLASSFARLSSLPTALLTVINPSISYIRNIGIAQYIYSR